MSETNLPRKGAKTQMEKLRAAEGLNFAPLRLCWGLLLLTLALSTVAFSQSKRFDPDGSFWIIGEQPTEFSEFGGINLNAKRLRRLPAPGLQLNNGTNYRFKTLTVKRSNLTFTTVTRRGVYYTFSGRFLKGGVFAMTELNDESPILEGTLTRYRGAKKEAEAKLQFHYFGGT